MSHVWPYMRLGLHAKRRHYWQIKIKFRFSGQIFEKKNSVIEFNENLVEPSCSIRTDGRTYWQTDRHDAFRNLAQDLYKSFLRFRLVRNWLLCQRSNTVTALPATVRFRLGAFPNLQIATLGFIIYLCSSVRARGTTLFPLHGFSWNLIFEDFFDHL